ncbi:MAG: SDR family oxidoreductase [Gammaproteobacteria bacterium]
MKKQGQNKVALITGADRGIGKAISERLAILGIDTVLISNNVDSLKNAKSNFHAKYEKSPLTISLDVRIKNQIDTAIAEVIDQYGKIDYLINVAGIAYYGGIELCTEEEWDETLNVNVKGYFLMAKSVFPHMKAAGEGMIINMSSVWGIRGAPTMLAYSTSKFAIEGFTKSLSEEARQYGIKVTSIILDKVDTPFRDEMGKYVNFSHEQKIRMLDVEDVADAVTWVISSSPRSLPSSITLDAFLWK